MWERDRLPEGGTLWMWGSICALGGLLGGMAVPAYAERNVVVTPQDHGRALVNPDMGWTMHFYVGKITVVR